MQLRGPNLDMHADTDIQTHTHTYIYIEFLLYDQDVTPDHF